MTCSSNCLHVYTMATPILQCICTTPVLYMRTGYALYEHLVSHPWRYVELCVVWKALFWYNANAYSASSLSLLGMYLCKESYTCTCSRSSLHVHQSKCSQCMWQQSCQLSSSVLQYWHCDYPKPVPQHSSITQGHLPTCTHHVSCTCMWCNIYMLS